MTIRVAIYARVSSAEQRDKQTIASQLRELPEYAARQGWQVVATYVDDGKSASKDLEARDGFQRLLADAGARRFDAVLAVDWSRLTRTTSWRERGEVIGALQDAGVRLAFMATGQLLDLAGGMGDLLAGLGAAMAADDQRRRTEAFVRGKREAVVRGCKPGGATPYGMTWRTGARDATGWGVDEEKAAIVRDIYERVAAGESCRSIALALEAGKVAPPRTGRWLHNVARIVASPAYRGVYVANKKLGLQVACPRLVDDATWYAANAQLGRSKLRGLRRVKYAYVCAGRIRCACGSPMTIAAESRTTGGRRYYVCEQRRRPRAGRPRCTGAFVRVDALDQLVWEALAIYLARPRNDLLAALLGAAAVAAEDAGAWASDERQYSAKLAELERAEVEILGRFSRGQVSQGALDKVLADLSRRRSAIGTQLALAREQAAAAAQRGAGASSLAELLDELRAAVAGATPEERRDIAAVLIRQVVPEGAGARVTLALEAGIHTAPCTGEAGLGRAAAPEQGARVVELRVVRSG